jgi:NitT/TauT family transport system permease protein
VVIYMATMAALYGLLDAAFVAAQNWLLKWKQ